jgi:peroxiredoxin
VQVLGRPSRDVIGADGVVAHLMPKITPRTHDDEVLGVLERLAAAEDAGI